MMKIQKNIVAKYPTVTFGSVEIFTSIEISEEDLPGEIRALPFEQRAALMDKMANQWVSYGFETEYNQVHIQLANKYLGGILPPELEKKLIMEGKLKR